MFAGINCEALIELDCVELLLRLLQTSDLSVNTQLNVVVCLGMLAEENSQCVLFNILQCMLCMLVYAEVGQSKVAKSESVCLLVNVLARSGSEELNKATTFLLQCCVVKGKSSSPPHSSGGLVERVAHMDQLLTQEVNVSVLNDPYTYFTCSVVS